MGKPPVSLPVVKREALDNSILSSLARCPRLAFYNYVLNRSGRGDNYPINFGIAFHNFMEALEQGFKECDDFGDKDARVAIFEAAWAVAITEWKDPPIEHRKSYLDKTRLEKTCKEAFIRWVNEKSTQTYITIGTETAFDLPLPSGRRFTGRLDRIIEWNGRLWVLDYKTTGRKDDFKKKYNPDHQFTGYVWAANKLSGRMPEGVIVDVVYNTKNKGPEFYPTFASRSKGDIEHWLEWVEDQWDEWQNRMTSGKWPMQTTACNDFGGCYFKEACNSGSWVSAEDWLDKNTVESYWDPLNPEGEKGLPE